MHVRRFNQIAAGRDASLICGRRAACARLYSRPAAVKAPCARSGRDACRRLFYSLSLSLSLALSLSLSLTLRVECETRPEEEIWLLEVQSGVSLCLDSFLNSSLASLLLKQRLAYRRCERQAAFYTFILVYV